MKGGDEMYCTIEMIEKPGIENKLQKEMSGLEIIRQIIDMFENAEKEDEELSFCVTTASAKNVLTFYGNKKRKERKTNGRNCIF